MNRKVTAEETKFIQIELLSKFHDFCESHGIRYSLSGGSLIGAVRHKGFIPWDDDIDLMLPRPDYDRFITEFEGAYPEVSLLTYHKGTRYHLPFAKISDDRTYRKGFEEIGVCIDVFPIDGLPSKDNIDSFFKEKKKLDSIRYEIYYFNNPIFRKHKLSFLKYIKCYIKNKLFLPSWEDSVKNYEAYIKRYSFETSELGAVIFGQYGRREIMAMPIFQNYIKLPFEGREFQCIRDYDKYLSNIYGDYMKLPPEDKRKPRHVHEIYWRT